MQKMRFDSKQKDVTIMEPESGVYDVMVLTNEEKVVEKNEQPESGGESEVTYWQYDGNNFRTFSKITEDEIKNNLEYYLNVDSEERPTEEMQAYADKVIDQYTATLIEGGIL